MANDLMGTAEASLAKSPDTPRSGTTNLLPIRETVNQRHAIITSWYFNMQPSYRTDDLLAAASCSCFAITAWRGALETRRWPPYPPFFNSHIPLFLPHFLALVLAALIPPLDPRLDRLISSSRSRRGPLVEIPVLRLGCEGYGQKKEGKIEGEKLPEALVRSCLPVIIIASPLNWRVTSNSVIIPPNRSSTFMALIFGSSGDHFIADDISTLYAHCHGAWDVGLSAGATGASSDAYLAANCNR
ncbi:hypothetical protein B0H13DRAFT_1902175 [Mycena leptocephala]|nr:hypothetical protein B0H13DRAFT_1902175 [Mycena leptocephala]